MWDGAVGLPLHDKLHGDIVVRAARTRRVAFQPIDPGVGARVVTSNDQPLCEPQPFVPATVVEEPKRPIDGYRESDDEQAAAKEPAGIARGVRARQARSRRAPAGIVSAIKSASR